MKNKQQKESNGFIPTIKTLSKSVREYKKPSFLAPLFVAIEVVMECLIPYIMTLLLDKIKNISESADTSMLINEILKYGGVLLGLAVVSLICGVLAGKFCATASSGFAKNLRKDMFKRIQGFSFSNIDKFSTSSLVTRLTTDVTNVELSYMMIVRTAIRAPFMLIFSMIMAFTINSTMALIFLGTVPLLATGLILIMKKAIPFFNRIFHKYDALNESVQENIHGMRVVKSYVREDYEKEKFDKASANVRNDFTKAEKLVALNGPLMNFCIYAGLILIYIIGSSLIINSKEKVLKLAELQSFMTYSFQMLMSLMMLSMIMVMIIMSVASAKRISEVLNEQSSIISPENGETVVEDGSIEFENVCFKYSEQGVKYVLEDIDLKIESGQTVGILGSTGSGKTSLINLIPRLYDANTGVVKVGNKNVKEYDLNALRNSVATVLQKNLLFSGTIRDNMKWGDKTATDEEIHHALALAQIDNYELDKAVEQGGANFSGGQKQRLCIARALLKKPKILILDDSTSAVDTKTDALIRKAFKEYIPETTKIIIAQRVASVQDADLILIMDNGRIVAKGTHEQLLKNNSIYQELNYSQNKGGKQNG
ncbi:MAG: ABC transporter ATP-binding protein [Clostridia bacterium]|nr:ABC transporter ATP-binding protein [Clostridia bacterium]